MQAATTNKITEMILLCYVCSTYFHIFPLLHKPQELTLVFFHEGILPLDSPCSGLCDVIDIDEHYLGSHHMYFLD